MANALPTNPSDTVWRFIPRTRRSGKRSAPARRAEHVRALAALMLACMAIFGYSSQAEAQTLPSAPTLTATANGQTKIDLEWTASTPSSGGTITGYRLEVSDNNTDWSVLNNLQFGATARSYSHSGLEAGTRKWYRVKAEESRVVGGETVYEYGLPSVAESATTDPPTAPGAPQLLLAYPGNGQVVLSWIKPSSDGGRAITDYEYRYNDGTSWIQWASAGIDQGIDQTVTVRSLTNGTLYTFEVRARNSLDPAGVGPAAPLPGERLVTATPNVSKPGTPRALAADPGNGQVVLTWAAPSSNGGATITGYWYRYREGTGPDTDDVSVSTDFTETVSNLTNDTEYTFELWAVNSEGPGPVASVAATPSASPQPDPDPELDPGTPNTLSPDTGTTTLVAEAGENRTIAQGEEITLDGSASTDPAGGTVTYQWTYTGGRTDITLMDAETATPTYTAPTGLTADVVLTFSLVVTDQNRSSSAADTVEITITSQAVRQDGTDALTFHPKTGDEVWISAGTTVTLQVLPEGRSAPAGLAVTLPAEALTGAAPTLTIDLEPTASTGFRADMTVVDITLTGGTIPAGKTATVCLPGTDSQTMLQLYDDET